MSLGFVVTIDLFVVGASLALLLRHGGLRHSHPAVAYLIFHVVVITSRGIAVAAGSPTFLEGVPNFQRITNEEIVKAILLADVLLASLTAGWLRSKVREAARPKNGGSAALERALRPSAWISLQSKYITGVAVFAVPFGLYTLSRYAALPGVDQNVLTSRSSYAVLALTWPGLLLVALIYKHGFRLAYTAPLVLYLIVVGLQGGNRFRLVIPVILLCQIYLDRRGKRWPGAGMITLLVALALLFFPLKAIGNAVQEGVPISGLVTIAADSVDQTLQGQADDQALLDQLAATVTAVDQKDYLALGRPYANTLVLPVPRELWAGKPGLADFLQDLSEPSRPLKQIGAVVTIVGDLYLNFNLFGLVVGGFLLGLVSGNLFRRAYEVEYNAVGRFAYLLLAANLLQVYRDGLISVPVFLLVQMLPLILITLLHYRGASATRRSGTGAPAGGLAM